MLLPDLDRQKEVEPDLRVRLAALRFGPKAPRETTCPLTLGTFVHALDEMSSERTPRPEPSPQVRRGRDAGGMFEHPRDCGNWQATCPGSSLTHNTRLNGPTENLDDGIEGDTDEPVGLDMDGKATLDDLEEQIASVERAKIALRRRVGRLILEDRHEDLDDQLSALLREYPAG